jgi:hypothetical protein
VVKPCSELLPNEKIANGYVIMHENDDIVAATSFIKHRIIASRQPLLIVFEELKAIGPKLA